LIEEAVRSGARLWKACEVIGITVRTYQLCLVPLGPLAAQVPDSTWNALLNRDVVIGLKDGS
jgi:hypothetical protein